MSHHSLQHREHASAASLATGGQCPVLSPRFTAGFVKWGHGQAGASGCTSRQGAGTPTLAQKQDGEFAGQKVQACQAGTMAVSSQSSLQSSPKSKLESCPSFKSLAERGIV